MVNKSGAFIVGYDIGSNDMASITVAEHTDSAKINLIKVIQGDEALALYNALIKVDKK